MKSFTYANGKGLGSSAWLKANRYSDVRGLQEGVRLYLS